jgi:hypothetical protein
VVDDFLELAGLPFTRSLLHTEAGLPPSMYVSKTELCSQLETHNVPQTEPILRWLILCGPSQQKARLSPVKTTLFTGGQACEKRCQDPSSSGLGTPDAGGILAFSGTHTAINGCHGGPDSRFLDDAHLEDSTRGGLLANDQDLVSTSKPFLCSFPSDPSTHMSTVLACTAH